MAHGDIDLDAPLWEHDANEDEYIDAGEGVGIEGNLDVEDERNPHLYAYVYTLFVPN